MAKKTKGLNGAFFCFLMDSEGIVCGLTVENNSFGIDIGNSWHDLWPEPVLTGNISFTFNHVNKQWLAEVRQLIRNGTSQASYLATYTRMSEQANCDNNQLKKLQQKLQFYETVIIESHDEIFITDGNGKIIFANPASEVNYGLTVSEMLGKSVWEHEEKGIYYPAIVPIVLKEKKKITINQETATGKKLVVTGTPVFDKKGEIEIVICNSRDVTSLEDMKKSYQDMKKKVLKKESVKKEFVKADNYKLIYTENSPLVELMGMLNKVAKTESTVLLQGDTGTGKDLFAKRIHELSNRRDNNFLKVNCAALPRELIESELFGYKAGAFTGASNKGKIGQFSLTDQGTIFLDEIAEIPMNLQPKLLQVIEEQKFTPIGSKTVEKVDVRIIASTNRDLNEMVKAKQFRDDLYYRLCVFYINIPPLKDRKEDIPYLINHYLLFYNQKHNCSLGITNKALEYLTNYNWPGNVRELKHLVERLTVTVSSDQIKPDHLPDHILLAHHDQKETTSSTNKKYLYSLLQDTEREIILNSYRRLKSSYKVASELGISQSSAIRKIRRYTKQA
jgi:PAS domain S-box-containing protein